LVGFFFRVVLIAYLHDVTSAKGLQVNLEQGWQFQHCFHTEQS
jgi:hypothetical protein